MNRSLSKSGLVPALVRRTHQAAGKRKAQQHPMVGLIVMTSSSIQVIGNSILLKSSKLEEQEMNLNANAFGLAAAITTAVLWIICSLVVFLVPEMSMTMGGYMMHTDVTGMQWDMNLAGFLTGLVIWAVTAYVFGWLMALIYNRFS